MGSWILPHNMSGSNNTHCKLPSIHSLSLDLPPVGMPPPSAAGAQPLAPALAPGFAVAPAPVHYQPQYPLARHQPLQQPNKEYSPSYLSPPGMMYNTQSPKSHTGLPGGAFGSGDFGRTTQLISPISSPPAESARSGLNSLCTAADMEKNITARVQRAMSASSAEVVSDASASAVSADASPAHSASEDENSTLEQAVKLEAKSSWKPRKKRQCPECKLYFSNLATHKSTHLKPASRPHICEYCSRGFARPNDLFRHVKCHWKELGSDKGQFRCPYKGSSESGGCFHTSGIFSRCDTFKNHLKAIHFQYPLGTRRDQRNKVNGHCKQCHKDFKNVDDWMVNHVEKNLCPYANPVKKN